MQTFEERLALEVDALFAGALFLVGGRTAAAEDLLVRASVRAFRACRRDGAARDRELEATLVAEFLDSASRWDVGGVDRDHPLFRSGAELSPRARAALWLVLFRRWSYVDVQGGLEIGRDELGRLLDGRTALWGSEPETPHARGERE